MTMTARSIRSNPISRSISLQKSLALRLFRLGFNCRDNGQIAFGGPASQDWFLGFNTSLNFE